MGTGTRPKTRPAKPSKADGAIASEAWNLMQEIFMANKPRMMALCKEFDLFPPQMHVLHTLSEPKPMREVARFLACDNSNLTGIIDRLEERKLVRRTVAEHDRRVKLLVLTDAGERMRKEIVARMAVPPAELEALSGTELRSLRNILAKAQPGD